MNGATFNNYLSNPEKLDAASLLQLEELIKEYPYFQAGQVLYVKNLQNQENIRFNKQLKLTAAYVSNRKVLYELLKAQPGANTESKPVVEHKAEPVIEPIVEPAVELIPETPMTTLTSVEDVQSNEGLFELLEDQVDEESVGSISNENTEKDEKSLLYNKSDYLERIETFVPIADIDLLLFDFPAGGNADVLEFEFEKRAPTMEGEDQDDDDLLRTDLHTTSFELIRQFLKIDPIRQNPKPSPPRAFVSNEVSIADDRQPKPDSDSEPLTGKEKSESIINQDLVDVFIQEEPRIPRAVDESEPLHGDISLGSLKEDESFMTETLADIYMRQGYYYKAMQAFEKLSLKYPEKSIYFASQIEKIKELINNQ